MKQRLVRKHANEDPGFYPHKNGDRVVNLFTEKQGEIVSADNFNNSLSARILVKYDDGTEGYENVYNIANIGNVQIHTRL